MSLGLLKNCHNNTSPGEDRVPYVVIKQLPEVRLTAIIKSYNICLCRGYFPVQYKQGFVTMTPKLLKPKSKATSYRPISLLNCLGKLFEYTLPLEFKIWLMMTSSTHGKGLINQRKRPMSTSSTSIENR